MANPDSAKVRTNAPSASEPRHPPPLAVWHAAQPEPAEGVNVSELWDDLRERKWLVLACALALILATLGATLVSRMQFKAAGGLYLGDLEQRPASGGANAEALDFLGGGRAELGTEIEVLRSESLVGRAIVESGLNVDIRRVGEKPLRYLAWRLSNRDPSLVDATAHELGARDVVLSGRARPRTYRAHFTSPTEYELLRDETRIAQGKLGEPLAAPEVNLTLVAGSERRPPAGSVYELAVQPLDDAIERAFDALNVSSPRAAPGQTVNVVRLEFSHESPSVARSFLDCLMRGYLERRQLWRTEKASAVESFVSEQLGSMRASLDDAERHLAEYKKASGAVVLSAEAKTMIEQIGKFQEQQVAVRLQVSALRDIQRVLSNRTGSAPVEAYLLGEAQDTVLAGLGASLTEAQEQLKKSEHQFTEDAPAVREQRAQVDAQLEMVKNYVATRLARAQEQLGSIDHIIGQSNEKLKTVPHAELRLAQLVRDSEVLSKMYSYLLERKQQAAIVKAATISDNRILDLPKVRYRESSPKLSLRLTIAGLLGLVLGALVTLVRARVATEFRSLRDVRRVLPHAPVFAVLPRRPRAQAGASHPLSLEAFASRPGSAFRESFRLLRANVYRAGAPALSRVILISSLDDKDGKTTVALGLAATLAAEGNRVLVVDGSGRRENHHAPLARIASDGLVEVLAGERAWSDVVHLVPCTSGGFFSLGAGNADIEASERFSGPRFAAFLAEVRAAYSFILIDAPSLSHASETLSMSAYADLLLIVLRLGNSKKSGAAEQISRLTQSVESALVINAPETSAIGRSAASELWTPVQSPQAQRTQAAPLAVLRRTEGRP